VEAGPTCGGAGGHNAAAGSSLSQTFLAQATRKECMNLGLYRILWPLAAALGACAGLPAAQMALPPDLAMAAPEPVQGIGIGRSGDFLLGTERGTFQRGKDRLEIFEALSFDRTSTRYRLVRSDGGSVQAACRGRQTGVALSVLAANARPFSLECEWSGAQTARMSLSAPSAMPGSEAQRSGRFTLGSVELELKSVHSIQGSPLPLEAPIGYLLLHEGRPVGAIELNGSTPRLWRPAASTPLAEPVTLAALALALMWDPAN
jgi:hypothetical protein